MPQSDLIPPSKCWHFELTESRCVRVGVDRGAKSVQGSPAAEQSIRMLEEVPFKLFRRHFMEIIRITVQSIRPVFLLVL